MITLRLSSWILLAVLPAIWIGLSASEMSSAVLFPALLLSPCAIVYTCYFRWARVRCGPVPPDDLFVRTFFAGFGPGALLAIASEVVVSSVLAAAINSNVDASTEEASAVPRTVLFVLGTAYVTAALVEEAVKATLVRSICCNCWCGQPRRDPLQPGRQAYTTVALLLATALGFATAENIMYVFGGTGAASGSGGSGGSDGSETLVLRVILVIVRSAVSLPLHVVCAGFTALRLALRDAQRGHNEALWAAGWVRAYLGMLPPQLQAGALPAQATGAALEREALSSDDALRLHLHSLALAQPPPAPPAVAVAVAPPPSSVDRAALPPLPGAYPLPVWSWPRVLWPAVLVHGTFDAVAMLLPALLTPGGGDGGSTSDPAGGGGGSVWGALARLLIILGTDCILLGVAVSVLVAQFAAAFGAVAAGEVPRALTCGPPARVCSVARAAALWSLGCAADAAAPARPQTAPVAAIAPPVSSPPTVRAGAVAAAAAPASPPALGAASSAGALSPSRQEEQLEEAPLLQSG